MTRSQLQHLINELNRINEETIGNADDISRGLEVLDVIDFIMESLFKSDKKVTTE